MYIYIYNFKLKYIPYKIHKYYNLVIYFEQFFDKICEQILTT